LLELAHLHIAGGQPDRARALLADVRAIAEGLDAAPTLARVAALEQRLSSGLPAYPAGLTAREVDVLRLVARGMSDAEVAERLFISPRTVGSHLTSIYTKLDVGSRTAAAAAARDYGIA
jgi:DNA-binding CsgD family transcriptional regulator